MFTDRYIRALKFEGSEYWVSDDSGRRGSGKLQVRVRDGIKEFYFQYFVQGRRKRIKLGQYGTVTLADAWERYEELARQVAQGVDPKLVMEAERRQRKEEEARQRQERERIQHQATLGQLIEEFLAHEKAKRKPESYANFERTVSRDLRGNLPLDLPASDLTSDHCQAVLARVYQRGSASPVETARQAGVSLLRWAITQDTHPGRFGKPARFGITVNYFRDLPNVWGSSTPRNRFLDAAEVRQILTQPGYDYDPAVLFMRLNLALCGQRIREVLRAQWSEIDWQERLLLIPKARTKMQRGDHVVPLNQLALVYLERALELRDERPWIFPSQLDRNLPLAAKTASTRYRDLAAAHGWEGTQLRDLRRTAKTHMAKAGLDPSIRDLIQQHVTPGVAKKHYDRYDYLAEKRALVAGWNEYLQGIIEGGEGEGS